MNRLNSNVAGIAGASSGTGPVAAQAFTDEGAKAVLCGADEASCAVTRQNPTRSYP